MINAILHARVLITIRYKVRGALACSIANQDLLSTQKQRHANVQIEVL